MIVFRTSKVLLLVWYGFVIMICAVFYALFHDVANDIPPAVIAIPALLPLAALLAPLPMFKAKLVVSDVGILQYVPFGGFYKWDLSWDDIDDWSLVEIAFRTKGGANSWDPYIFIAAKNRVFATHNWIAGRKELKVVANALVENVGYPKDLDHPVISKKFKYNEWRNSLLSATLRAKAGGGGGS